MAAGMLSPIERKLGLRLMPGLANRRSRLQQSPVAMLIPGYDVRVSQFPKGLHETRNMAVWRGFSDCRNS